jgi:DNA ligase (NAD+)
MAEKSAQNAIGAIEASKQRSVARLIFALGIRHVGAQVAGLLANHFLSLDALMQASQEAVSEVEGIGPKIAESIVEYFADEANRAVIERLRAAGVRFEQERPAPSEDDGEKPLAGQTFVVTGRLERSTRTQIEARIKALGGAIADSVSKKTSFVVVGEDAGSKLAKAQKLGTTILDEDTFEKLAAGEVTLASLVPPPPEKPAPKPKKPRASRKKLKTEQPDEIEPANEDTQSEPAAPDA